MTWLRFQMDLSDEPKDNLILGELALMEGGNAIKTYPVTSGIAPHQHKRSQSLKGAGPIPSCDSVGLGSYFVNTEPIDHTGLIGVEGNFYWINTPPKVVIAGIERSEFGIHFDANVPGSAGCIVFEEPSEWDDFQDFMSEYRSKGFNSIALIVEYNAPPAPPADPLFSIGKPQNKSVIKIAEPLVFQGGITDNKVKKIVITAGPGGPFPVGEAVPDQQGGWRFQKTLSNTGKDRPFWFVAEDENGEELQRQELVLTLVGADQTLAPSKFFTISEPDSGAQSKVNRSVKFSGTAKPEVKAIVASAGPEGPFKIASVVPVGEKWEFEYKFNRSGINRPIWISAFDVSGNPLETAETKISVVPGNADLSKIPIVNGPDSGESQNWRTPAKPYIEILVRAFQDQGIFNPIVYAYACASISRESSWNPEIRNTSDAASETGYPGWGLAQITWIDNYRAAQEDTGIPFVSQPELMTDPYSALRAKAAYFKRNGMIPFIESGDYESAAGTYNAGFSSFRSVYTRRILNDVPYWIPVFRTDS